jgi:hypothetical protein
MTKKRSAITPAIARITITTQGMAPCGDGALAFFGFAGRNLAITVDSSTRARYPCRLSPWTKNRSISLYSRIFTGAPSGALPCAIARNACSE